MGRRFSPMADGAAFIGYSALLGPNHVLPCPPRFSHVLQLPLIPLCPLVPSCNNHALRTIRRAWLSGVLGVGKVCVCRFAWLAGWVGLVVYLLVGNFGGRFGGRFGLFDWMLRSCPPMSPLCAPMSSHVLLCPPASSHLLWRAPGRAAEG